MIEKLAEKIVAAQIKSPATFIITFLLITIVLLPGLLGLVGNVEPSLEKVLPSEVPEIKLMNQLRAELGADMMYLLLHVDTPATDVREESVMLYTHLLSERLRDIEYVKEVRSAADIIVREHGFMPDSQAVIEQSLNSPMSSEFISHDKLFTVIMIRSDTGADAATINRVVDDVDEAVYALEPYNPGLKLQLTGYNAIDKATFEVIINDFMLITGYSFAFIFLVVFLTFRKLRKTLMPLTVVMVAVLWTMGIVGYLGLTITVVSMVSVAMILGLGIDFGIHVTHLYSHQRHKHGKKKSLRNTMHELLRAMIGGSFTTMAGFLALLFGVLPAMKVLGIILAIGILNTLIGAVFLLPVLLYATDKGGKL